METMELGYVERIRALVGRNGWDYCVLWKLSSNQRSMELLGCLCGGFENNNTQLFEISATCRDAMLHHSRTRACDFLAEVPSYINLDSSSTGVYAHALLSNTPRWLFLSNTTINPSISDENVRATQVLVPIPGGLVELFAEKLVNEDQHVIEFIMSNFSTKTYDLKNQQLSSTTMINYLSKENDGTLNDNGWIPSPAASGQLSYLCNQIYTDHLHLSNPSPNDTDQVRSEAAFFEGSADSTITEKPFFTFKAMPENSLPRVYEQTILENCDEDIAPMMSKPKGSSASDTTNHGEDEDEYKSRGGKKPAKNLIAERNRREKLNSRLLRLRALVPNISKMDKAAIVVDAIDYVKELQEQVKTLQNELERTNFEEEGGRENVEEEVEHHHKYQVETLIQGRQDESAKKFDRHPKSFEEDNGQHKMEVQVEVCEVGRNEFFVKVFCEHKFGGFVSLMEAINSLGLEVTNANVTTFRTLVLNVFKVEKRDNEVLEAEEVRSSLLELTGSSDSSSSPSAKRRKTDVQTLNYTYQHQPLAYQF